jgi:hypothetical protein
MKDHRNLPLQEPVSPSLCTPSLLSIYHNKTLSCRVLQLSEQDPALWLSAAWLTSHLAEASSYTLLKEEQAH